MQTGGERGGRTPGDLLDSLLGLRNQRCGGGSAEQKPMGPLELPPHRLREPIGVPRCAERRHDLGPDARLLRNLARGANFDL